MARRFSVTVVHCSGHGDGLARMRRVTLACRLAIAREDRGVGGNKKDTSSNVSAFESLAWLLSFRPNCIIQTPFAPCKRCLSRPLMTRTAVPACCLHGNAGCCPDPQLEGQGRKTCITPTFRRRAVLVKQLHSRHPVPAPVSLAEQQEEGKAAGEQPAVTASPRPNGEEASASVAPRCRSPGCAAGAGTEAERQRFRKTRNQLAGRPIPARWRA